jgi:hypothetical protein
MTTPRRDRRGSGGAALLIGVIALVVVAVGIVTRVSSSGGAHGAGSTHRGVPAVPPLPTNTLVATGQALRFGEPVAATTATTRVVAATVWLPTTAVVETWQRTGTEGWSAPQQLLPTGFHRGYDPSVAALSDGTVVVSSGVDLAVRPYCIDAGSVAVQRIDPSGPSTPVLVDDERGGTGFDDRPTVAAGSGMQVWVGWSHGTAADACDLVGQHDQIMVSVSANGGRRFGRPFTIATLGANFGVQIAPTGPGHAEIAWAESFPSGLYRILVAQITDSHLVGPPTVVGAGTALPAHLPGASFPSFTLPSLTLTDGRPALTWASWIDSRAVIDLALPATSGSGWRRLTILPAAGHDDLLPSLGTLSNGTTLLLNAVHRRATDSVAYEIRAVGTSSTAAGIATSGVRTIAGGGPGPAFRELGESLQIATDPAATTTGFVVASAQASRLETAVWTP